MGYLNCMDVGMAWHGICMNTNVYDNDICWRMNEPDDATNQRTDEQTYFSILVVPKFKMFATRNITDCHANFSCHFTSHRSLHSCVCVSSPLCFVHHRQTLPVYLFNIIFLLFSFCADCSGNANNFFLSSQNGRVGVQRERGRGTNFDKIGHGQFEKWSNQYELMVATAQRLLSVRKLFFHAKWIWSIALFILFAHGHRSHPLPWTL